MQDSLFRIMAWYERLDFREWDVANDYERNPFPQELLKELRENRADLHGGSIALRNKAFELARQLQRWRDNLSPEARWRMEYFRFEPPWDALDEVVAETREIQGPRRRASRRDALLVAHI